MACEVCNEVCGTVVQPTGCSGCSEDKLELPDVELPEIPDDSENVIDIPTVASVTTEDIDGTGVFDVYMRAGMNQLTTQYDAGRIKGADFAAAYIAQVELMMTEANKFVIGLVQAEIAAKMFGQQYLGAQYDNLVKMHSVVKTKAEANLVCIQGTELIANGKQDRTLKASQTSAQCKTVELYDRQIQGFGEKNQHDVLKTIMDAWAVQGVDIEPNQDNSVVGALQKTGVSAALREAIKNTSLKLT